MKKRILFSLLIIFLILNASAQSIMTVDLTKRSGSIKKTGMGNLFGVSNIAGGISDKTLISDAFTFVSSSQGWIGVGTSNPFNTNSVGPILKGTDVKMVCRFNDMLGGPYIWVSYADWLARVDNAMNEIMPYKEVILCIAPFNEPDNGMHGAFMTDPTLPGGTYDEKIN